VLETDCPESDGAAEEKSRAHEARKAAERVVKISPPESRDRPGCAGTQCGAAVLGRSLNHGWEGLPGRLISY